MKSAADSTAGPVRSGLWALAALGVVLAAALVCFNLLYLSVPPGWTPPYGFAPGVGAAFAGRWFTPRLLLSPEAFTAVALGLEGVMWATYLLALLLAARLDALPAVGPVADKRALRLVIAGAALAAVALILTPPTLSKDLYHYALFGRMIITRGLNPYVTPGDALGDDPLVALASWRFLPTHYGPVFTALSVLAAWLGGGGAIGTALAFKALAAIFGAATVWLVWALARDEGRKGLGPVLLLAWNPLFLLETAGSGHNEAVMLAPALAGLLLVRRGRTKLGFLSLVLSVHIKWVTAALAALIALDQLRTAARGPARLRLLTALAGIAVVTSILLYLPFWRGEASLATTARLLFDGRSIGTSSGAGSALGFPGVLAFAAASVAAALMVWRRGPALLLDMSATTSLAFVLFVFSWWFPWYLIPALTLLAPGPRTPLNRALLLLTFFAAVFLMLGWAALLRGQAG